MSDADDVHWKRLIADYDRLIGGFEDGLSKTGEVFGSWLSPMDGKLVLAALRYAREAALSRRTDTAVAGEVAIAEILARLEPATAASIAEIAARIRALLPEQKAGTP